MSMTDPVVVNDPARDLREAKKEARKYRKALKELTDAVSAYLVRHDSLMAEILVGLENKGRGKKVAALANALDMENDRARYFGLGIDYRTDTQKKKLREKLTKRGSTDA